MIQHIEWNGTHILGSKEYKGKEITIYKEKVDPNFVIDCLEKINYAVADINMEIDEINNGNKKVKDILAIITFMAWINESNKLIKNSLIEKYADAIEDKNTKYKEFCEALRSMVLAHPFETNRHPEYGMSGDILNSDMRTNPSDPIISMGQSLDDKRILDIDGLHNIKNRNEIINKDFWLLVYDKKLELEFKHPIGVSLQDIMAVINYYIERIEKLEIDLCKEYKYEENSDWEFPDDD